MRNIDSQAIERDLKKVIGGASFDTNVVAGKIRVAVEVAPENWRKTINSLFHENLLAYVDLKAMTAMNEQNRVTVVIELHSYSRSELLNIRTVLAKNEVLESVTSLWPYADWYEHEINHRFGAVFNGIPSKTPYMMGRYDN